MIGDDLLTERLLRVVDEGRRVATYKLALLLALIDAAALAPGQTSVGTRDLAARVLEVYYPQTRPYVANDAIERELRQITANGSPLLRAVLDLRQVGEAAGHRSLYEIQRNLPDGYERTVDSVESTLVRDPIPRLQRVGTRIQPFLYEVDWPEGTSVTTLRIQGRDRLTFLDGALDRLVVLGPLLRPLIELHWTRDVARWTGMNTEEDRLRAHLFGNDRTSIPPKLRKGLAELQEGLCFYCHSQLGRTAQVDHFLARSRWPNDAVENLVLADRCNGQKSDHLAAPAHLDRWLERCRTQEKELSQLADATRWPSDPDRSSALVRSTYLHLAPGTPLWLTGDEFVDAEGPIEPPT